MSQEFYDELQKPEYSNQTNAQKLAILNTKNIEYFIEPSTADLTNFLFNSGLYAKLVAVYRDHPVAQIRVAAECALDTAASQISNINLQNANVQTMLGALVQGQVFTQAEADSVMNFGRRFRSRADEILGRDATNDDLELADNWPVISHINALQNAAAQACNGVIDYIRAQREAALLGGPLPDADDVSAEFDNLLAEYANA